MEGAQNIYYALGILAYAVANSDGKIQHEEKDKLFEIVEKEMSHNINFEYAEIVFQLLERDKVGFDNTYNWAISELKKGRHYLSPEIKEKMINTLIEISKAFDHLDDQQSEVINRFKKDLEIIGSDHYLK